MTHEEAFDLLASYALGALEDPAELEAHLLTCTICTAELARQLETTAALAEAVEQVAPPASLRARVLAHQAPPIDIKEARIRAVPAVQPRSRDGDPGASPLEAPITRIVSHRASLPRWLSVAAAIVLLFVGFGAGSLVQRQQIQPIQSELTLDQQGLNLLTSTETSNARLAPVSPLGGDAHGHWFHRDGVNTQVLVVESMPPPPAGQSYFGWLQRADGTWLADGRFTLDATGYARIILPGGDGSDIRAVKVTQQLGETTAPGGTVVLRWP